jgi:hypothetical protein
MKSLFRSSVLAAAVIVLAGAHNAGAQIDNGLEFTTSFPFTVGNTTVPAGSYTITPVDNEEQVFELRGPHESVMFVTESVRPKQGPAKDEVVFNKYGDRYVLKSIFAAGSDTGYGVENALGERHIAKQGGAPSESRLAARKAAKTAK